MGEDAHRRRLELVLEGTRLGMWDWNPTTNEVVFDERWAEMLGYSLAEVEPTLESWSSRVHPDDLEQVFADIQAHMDGRTPFYENVHRMRHKDGRWVHILDRGRIAERDAEGRPTRFTGTHTDISAQRDAELRALELARGRTRFLATMSHELRTPLHGILGLLETLDPDGLGPAQRDTVALIRRVGEGLVTVVNDVLDFAKASEGALRLSPEPFDLPEVLGEVAALYRERLRPGVTLALDFDPGLGRWAFGDGHRLRQVLSNLASNAAKFTATGSVTLSARRDGDIVRFEVRDTGPGIADTSRLFRPYEQTSGDTARLYGGTGLGLAIVKHLVELAGGVVSVESAPGAGATFTVELPLPVVSAPREEPASAPDSLPPLSVLVADDNPVNRRVLERILRRAGVSVESVSDGRAALDAVCREGARFDALLLDLYMPLLDGDAALRELRARGVATPAVAVSADALHEFRERCQEAGFAGFLTKPFKKADLFSTLRRVCPEGAGARA